MRTTLTLDDQLYHRAKSIAALSGKRLGEVVSQLALEGLSRSSASENRQELGPTLDSDKPTRINLPALEEALDNLP